MRIRLLGPIDVVLGGAVRPLAGLRRKAVLAVLALHVNEIVSTDRLIDAVWGDLAPATAVNTLQRHLSYLRRTLGVDAPIVARPPGYVLRVEGEATDAERAERLIRHGTRSQTPAEGASSLRTALGLWRGRSLLDVAGLAWLDEQAERLEYLRLGAVRALADARLALGEHQQMITELEWLARQHPFDERIHEQLMLALYRTGRQSEALAAYQRLRRTLDADLGIEPGSGPRSLQAAILRQDPTLEPPPPPLVLAPSAPQAPPVAVPAQLPPGVPAFAGRQRELARLDRLIAGPGAAATAGQGRPPAVVIAAVSGTPGVGKTALALHWAHQVAASFPDGQLYVNLGGFGPSGSILEPAVAIRGFLDALEVPAQRIPADLAGRTALYRSVLAGKRMLVVLDNARDVEQVRPLLPGSPSCLVLVTSRNQLMPLVATEGAHPLALDLLTRAQAIDLLAGRLGADRVSREPDAVDDIIVRCARLPLALAIIAAHAAIRPKLPLRRLAVELRDTAGALDVLRGGDAGTDVRAVFSWSLRTLSSRAAQMFRLLGLHPGPDIGVPAAASLAGLPEGLARAALDELTAANLLTEHSASRYTFHDLLRANAAEQVNAVDSAEQRQVATHRMFDHYLRTGFAAAKLIKPAPGLGEDPAPARPGVSTEEIIDLDAAFAWFTAERAVLRAAVELASATGFGTHAWQLAWTLTTFLDRGGHWYDQIAVQQAALLAGQRVADRRAEAHARRGLGLAGTGLGRMAEARADYLRALELFTHLGDQAGQAATLQNLAWLDGAEGRHREALGHARRTLELFNATGDRAGQAAAFNGIGWYSAKLGEHHQALRYCRRALAIQQEIGDLYGQAHSLDSIAYAHHLLGDRDQAVGCYQLALDLFRAVGDRLGEATALDYLGDTWHAAGDHAAAGDAWRRAIEVFEVLGQGDTDEVRAKLRSLARTA